MPTLIMSRHEFVRENGGRPLQIGDVELLPSGARIGPDGKQLPPPDDGRKRVLLQREYAAAVLTQLEEQFHGLKTDALHKPPVAIVGGSFVPNLTSADATHLERLRQLVLAQRLVVSQLEQQLEALDVEREAEQPQPRSSGLRETLEQEAAETRRLISAITID